MKLLFCSVWLVSVLYIGRIVKSKMVRFRESHVETDGNERNLSTL